MGDWRYKNQESRQKTRDSVRITVYVLREGNQHNTRLYFCYLFIVLVVGRLSSLGIVVVLPLSVS